MLPAMGDAATNRVQALAGEDGAMTYLVDFAPDSVPCVRWADLERAWDAAHEDAARGRKGLARALLFRGGEAGPMRLALTDRDARCWAGAVDRLLGMNHAYGVAVCLRLLALVELVARAPSLAALCGLAHGRAELHPALLRAAATCRLDSDARLVEGEVQDSLGALAPAPGLAPAPAAGQ